MLRYKSYIALFAVAMVMASCSQDVIHDSDICENEVYATLPELNYENSVEGVTRSALVYDYSAQKMRFTWEEGDQLGVFPIIEDAGRRQQIRQVALSTLMTRALRLSPRIVNMLPSVHIPQKTTIPSSTCSITLRWHQHGL